MRGSLRERGGAEPANKAAALAEGACTRMKLAVERWAFHPFRVSCMSRSRAACKDTPGRFRSLAHGNMQNNDTMMGCFCSCLRPWWGNADMPGNKVVLSGSGWLRSYSENKFLEKYIFIIITVI